MAGGSCVELRGGDQRTVLKKRYVLLLLITAIELTLNKISEISFAVILNLHNCTEHDSPMYVQYHKVASKPVNLVIVKVKATCNVNSNTFLNNYVGASKANFRLNYLTQFTELHSDIYTARQHRAKIESPLPRISKG